MDSIERRAIREVHELHEFFVHWFRGLVGPERLERLSSALSADFRMISPSGVTDDRRSILKSMAGAHGRVEQIEIWIENAEIRWQTEEACLATYEEWQKRDGEVAARTSSVLFEVSTAAPNGLAWRHLHETWLPRPGKTSTE
jgi:hypothetical protein